MNPPFATPVADLSPSSSQALLTVMRGRRDAAVARRDDENAVLWGQYALALASNLFTTPVLAQDVYSLALSLFHIGHMDRACGLLEPYTSTSAACCVLHVQIKFTNSDFDSVLLFTTDDALAQLQDHDSIPRIPGEPNRLSVLHKYRGASYLKNSDSPSAKRCFLKALDLDPGCIDALRALAEYRLLSPAEEQVLLNQFQFHPLISDTCPKATKATVDDLCNVFHHMYLVHMSTASPSFALPLLVTAFDPTYVTSHVPTTPLEEAVIHLEHSGLSKAPAVCLARALGHLKTGNHVKAKRELRELLLIMDHHSPLAFVAYFDLMQSVARSTTSFLILNEMHEYVGDLLRTLPELSPLMSTSVPATWHHDPPGIDVHAFPSVLTTVIPGVTTASARVLCCYAIAIYLMVRALDDSGDHRDMRPAYVALNLLLELSNLFVPGMLLLAHVTNGLVSPLSLIDQPDSSFPTFTPDEIQFVYRRIAMMPDVILNAPESMIALARVARADGQLRKAKIVFQRAIPILESMGLSGAVELARVKGELGALFIKENCLSEGSDLLRQALMINEGKLTTDIRAPLMLALAHVNMLISKQLDHGSSDLVNEALGLVDEALFGIPVSMRASAYILRGDIYHKLDQVANAIQAYQKALTLVPRNIEITEKLHRVMAEHADLIARSLLVGEQYTDDTMTFMVSDAMQRAMARDEAEFLSRMNCFPVGTIVMHNAPAESFSPQTRQLSSSQQDDSSPLSVRNRRVTRSHTSLTRGRLSGNNSSFR